MTTLDGISGPVTVKKTTDYLDGFQYLKTENIGLIGMSDEMMSGLETSRALERQAFSVEPMAVATLASKNNDLQFFPTAEGFYDYKKDQYIYQYKDHLGNNRVSFGRNSAGALEITDTNYYYPFGMNHLKIGNSFFGINSYKNYKYNGKELQETGMYDYGARMYMSDIGRWGVVDPLAETSRCWSPYNYAFNNPIRFIDPDGRSNQDIIKVNSQGYVQEIIPQEGPHVVEDMDGNRLSTNDPSFDQEQLDALVGYAGTMSDYDLQDAEVKLFTPASASILLVLRLNVMNLKRSAPQVYSQTVTLLDNLDYQYSGNRLTKVIENIPNSTGYEGGNNIIDYDLNGSMINMKDKGIQGIAYNHLNLPDNFSITQVDPLSRNSTGFGLGYLYRADGVKVRKTYSTGGGRMPSTYKHTDYLNGFQYGFSETM